LFKDVEGANERPVTATPPAHRRHTCDHPIAPTGTPQDPVRTQVNPVGTPPKGADGPVAYGPRVGGPDPADTPTNGGSRGAAPPRNLCIKDGQRPTIHRPHRCRGPNGPRASVTPDHTPKRF
jgi:hypothetical protein